jgi:glycerol-3-phosphate acyltransferase PlsY
LKFKGGIELATAIGAIFGLAFIPCLISSLPAILALYIFIKTHYSGLAFFVSILTFSIILQVNPYITCTIILVGLLVGVNHWFRIKNAKDTYRTKTPYTI